MLEAAAGGYPASAWQKRSSVHTRAYFHLLLYTVKKAFREDEKKAGVAPACEEPEERKYGCEGLIALPLSGQRLRHGGVGHGDRPGACHALPCVWQTCCGAGR